MNKPEITVITGVTCSGKSALAMEIAQKTDAEIVSCDSVQIYRGMDIGSAKSDAADLARVPHHLIDVADVCEHFDVARYAKEAKKAAEDILRRGKKIVVVGGSGFYLKAWFSAVADEMQIPNDIRKTASELALKGTDALADALLKIDPNAAEFVDLKNPRRTKNAFMRCATSGKNCARLLDEFKRLPAPIGDFERKVFFLNPPDCEIKPRIAARTAQMLERGLASETLRLAELGIEKNPSAALAIGYRETLQWLKSGSSDIGALADEISRNTFALVKKQRKFFRRQLGLG